VGSAEARDEASGTARTAEGGARLPLAEVLAELQALPARPVLVVDPTGEAERAGDAAPGPEVVHARSLVAADGPPRAGPPAPPGGYGALVLLGGGRAARADLAAARGLLAPSGRLAVVLGPGEADGSALAELTRALYEERFAVLRSRRVAAGEGGEREAREVVLARRAEHRVRGYRPGDEAAIQDLFRRSFHQERPPSHWRWKYLDCPYGGPRISVAEGPEGDLVAHYAGYPLHLYDAARPGPAGLEAVAHHVGDTMTAPEARRVGRGETSLLARTMRHFFAAYCDGRVGLNYGFNAGRIHRYYRRAVNQDRHAPVTYRVRELPFRAAGGRAGHGGWRVERVERVGPRFDELFRRVRDGYGLLVVRDAAYLAWRYLARPDVRYELWTARRGRRLAGWGVFRREDGREGHRLVWGDALFDPERPDAAGALLERVAGADGAAGGGWIEGWFPPQPSWWDRTLRALGFVERPEPQDIGLVYLPFLRDPTEDLAARFYYTKGDGDLF